MYVYEDGLVLLTFKVGIDAEYVGVVVFFILQGDVTNKIERCLKLRTFSSDVGFPGTRSKNITVLCNHCCKVNTIPR